MVGGWAVGRGYEADYCVTLANCSNLQTVREGETARTGYSRSGEGSGGRGWGDPTEVERERERGKREREKN